MDSSPSRKDLSHDRIVDAAARSIRRNGFAATGVADVMKDAGLTHGGFYAHFASRNALLAEAVERAGRDSAERLARRTSTPKAREVGALHLLVDGYLSEAHLAATDSGCVIAALCSEMPRQAPEVREASATRVRALVDRVRAALPAGTPPAQAAVIASTMVGALQLARAVGDEREARAILKAARAALLAPFDTP